MEMKLKIGERAVINFLFAQVLTKPKLEEALMMRGIRQALDLNEVPNQIPRDQLDIVQDFALERSQMEWLGLKFKAAFEAQQIISVISDYALDLMENIEKGLAR